MNVPADIERITPLVRSVLSDSSVDRNIPIKIPEGVIMLQKIAANSECHSGNLARRSGTPRANPSKSLCERTAAMMVWKFAESPEEPILSPSKTEWNESATKNIHATNFLSSASESQSFNEHSVVEIVSVLEFLLLFFGISINSSVLVISLSILP